MQKMYCTKLYVWQDMNQMLQPSLAHMASIEIQKGSGKFQEVLSWLVSFYDGR